MSTHTAYGEPDARATNPNRAQWLYRVRRGSTAILAYGFLMLFAIVAILPIVWMFFSSLKSFGEFNVNPWLWPHEWMWGNYKRVWSGASFGLYFFNSLVLTILSVTLMILTGAMAGYGLARYQFPQRDNTLYYFVSGQVVPGQVVLIPLFIMIRYLGLLDTRLGLILVYTAAGLPFVVFNMQAFFRAVPRELEEVARIDGAGEFRIFWQIMLPLVRGGIGTMVIFQSMWIWNEFLFALVFASKAELRTLTVGIYSFVGEFFTDYPIFFSGLMVSVLPVIAVYLFTMRYVIYGVSAGAVKG